ncbi:hypothetical protein C8R47DRAFT_1314122 [Mycena vitilis]|nr:hypothetical protein C8R47DRAFT_1314122 [Mycena vitilis]
MEFRFIASVCLVLGVSFGGYLFHYAMNSSPGRLSAEEPNQIYPIGVSTKFEANGDVRPTAEIPLSPIYRHPPSPSFTTRCSSCTTS